MVPRVGIDFQFAEIGLERADGLGSIDNDQVVHSILADFNNGLQAQGFQQAFGWLGVEGWF